MLASPFPVGAKLLQMNQPPCIDQIVSSSWQPALIYIAGFDFNERFMLAIDRVKMRWRMLAIIEANDDAVKTTDFRHFSGLPEFCR